MTFSIDNKLSFIDSFQFLSSSLDSLVKNLNKHDLQQNKVWNKSEMKTMKDYHDFYLKCDVLLLADVFEKLRNNNPKNYGLCQSHYLSVPALRWDAMLNMIEVKLELIPDPKMHIFFETGTRGRVSYISNRYSKAENKYLKSYDPKQESNLLYT